MTWLRWVFAALGAVVGMREGYFGFARMACTVWWPNSNLCGLPAVPAAFAAASLGFFVCYWIGSKLTQSKM
jgi:hypothetical protein